MSERGVDAHLHTPMGPPKKVRKINTLLLRKGLWHVPAHFAHDMHEDGRGFPILL